MKAMARIGVTAALLMGFASTCSAEIYQWTLDAYGYTIPSTTLCPGGSGVVAGPGVDLSYRDLTKAYLEGPQYSNTTGLDLSNAKFCGAVLAYADFWNCPVTNADFTNADITGADFTLSKGLTVSQLYSTSTYKSGSLRGVGAGYAQMTGLDLSGRDASGSSFEGALLTSPNFHLANLRGTNFKDCELTNADLSGADLTDADWNYSMFRGANLTNACIRGAKFALNWGVDHEICWGLSSSQLYSTASYKSGDLTRIGLIQCDLTGWNFAGKDLSLADFEASDLTGADFTDAIVKGASFSRLTHPLTKSQLYSTATYNAGDLSGTNLRGNDLSSWSFSGKNLSFANFAGSSLSGTDFTDAIVRGANFSMDLYGYIPPHFAALTATQLYSTASYRVGDLTGMTFSYNDFTGWNFAGKNISNGQFLHVIVKNADFSGADTRGTQYLDLTASGLKTSNMIRPDGTINGLNLAGGRLTVRDYDGDASRSLAAIAVRIKQGMTMSGNDCLAMVFEDDAWDSTISFDAGIPVALGGTLELSLAAGVDPQSQVGRSFHVFDWTGVTPSGQFTISSPDGLCWDTSELYTTGNVTLIPEPVSLAMMAAGSIAMLLRRRRK